MAAARCLQRAWGVAAPDSFLTFRGLATVIPKVTQVDNSSHFLENVPHRQHPGILHLKSVKLPPELVEAASFLVAQSSVRNLDQQAKALTNYLWSRKRPLEIADLQRQAQQVEQKLKEELAHEKDALAHLGEAKEEKKLEKRVLYAIRKTTYHWKPLNYTEEFSFVYMVARMDGMFAAVSRAFHEIQKRVPDFQPCTLLDFGSGTGTVSWAAHSIWGKTIKEYMNIDSSAPMLALSEKLMKGTCEQLCFPGVYFRQFLPVSPKVKFDLVVSAFSLNELSDYSQRVETVQTLWRKTDGFLVLIENGTKEGHQMLMEARDVILKGKEKVTHDPRGAYVFAPVGWQLPDRMDMRNHECQCPHHLPCPRLTREHPLPCNFIQAYSPLPFHWNPSRKEEKFSFLILRRETGEQEEPWPRITQPVLCRPRHVHVHLCCANGTLQHAVLTPRKHGRDLYRCARNSACGDRLPVLNPESELALEEEKGPMDEDQS